MNVIAPTPYHIAPLPEFEWATNARVCVRVQLLFPSDATLVISVVCSASELVRHQRCRHCGHRIDRFEAPNQNWPQLLVGIRDAATAVRSVRVIKITVGTAMVAFIKAFYLK